MNSMLMLACFMVAGFATHVASTGGHLRGPLCPISWVGNPFCCEEISCGQSSDCQRGNVLGTCCRTSCGGQGCYFESVRVARMISTTTPSSPKICPAAPWEGESKERCTQDECSAKECVRNGVRGYCCATSCGGYNCHFPQESCPDSGKWNGLDAVSCPKILCTGDRNCTDKDQNGSCCQTSCGGRNCFFSNTTTPAAEVTSKAPEVTPRPKRTFGTLCPLRILWVGISDKNCSQHLCLRDNECDGKGLCCPTKCGGTACLS